MLYISKYQQRYVDVHSMPARVPVCIYIVIMYYTYSMVCPVFSQFNLSHCSKIYEATVGFKLGGGVLPRWAYVVCGG